MPANVLTAKNFLLDTDYPLDKIIYMVSGSTSVASLSVKDVPTPHFLTFTPLMDGEYSTSSDFSSNVFGIGSGIPYAGASSLFAYATSVDADTINVNFHVFNETSSSAIIYYRLFGFMPSNVDNSVVPTVNQSNNFVLDTDLNYTKLFAAQRLTTNGTITHNLGYNPQVSSWYEIIGTGTYKTIAADINNPSPVTLVNVTTTNVQVSVLAGYAAHVRVYLDE